MRRSPIRIAATWLLAAGIVTCTDAPTAPGHRAGLAHLDVAPQFTAEAQRALASLDRFSLTISTIRVFIQRPPSETLVDTTIAFPAGADSVVLDLAVQLQATSEQLLADVQLLDANGNIVFEGKSTITATQGGVAASTPAPITLAYVGPGAGATTLAVAPKDTTIVSGHTAQYSAVAHDAAGAVVLGAPITWTSSDESIATVDASTGLASGVRVGTVTITGRTPGGIADVATLHVVNPPAKLQVVGGDAQTGAVGTALAQPFVVLVTAADGSPIAGVTVTFRALTTGGSVSPAAVATDAAGHASATATLGSKPGAYAFDGSVAGLAPLSVSVSATATAGSAATLAIVSGNGQVDSAGKALKPLVVKATDSFGNPVPNAAVTWTKGAGGGSLSASTTTTDAAGTTSVTYTLGAKAGSDTVVAQAAGGAGPSATFTMTATPRAPSALVIVSGGGQSVVAGAALPLPLVAEVRDDKGNAIAGASVQWKVTTGAGTPSAAQTTSDSVGRTSVTFTTSTKAGADTVTAQVAGTTATASFGATALAGPAALIQKLAGDGQTAVAGSAVAIAPSVKVTDINSNGIAGVAVTFAVMAGGGAVTGGSVTTGASGVATVGSWTLGATPGTNTLSVAAANIGTSFSATALSSLANRLTLQGSDTVTTTAGVSPSPAPKFFVSDSAGAGLPGVSLHFVVMLGATTALDTSLVTDAGGIVDLALMPPPIQAGTFTMTASNTSLAGSPITGMLIVNPAAANHLVLLQQPSSTVSAATNLPRQPAVQVVDAYENPVHVAGVQIGVNWGSTAVADRFSPAPALGPTRAGGKVPRPLRREAPAPSRRTSSATGMSAGAPNRNRGLAPRPGAATAQVPSAPRFTLVPPPWLTGDTSVTNASGVAQFDTLRLNLFAGNYVLDFFDVADMLTGVQSDPVNVTPGAADNVMAVGLTEISGVAGAAVADTLSVRVQDVVGNGVPGVTVTFAPASGSGTVTGATPLTDQYGNAAVGSWTLPATAGTYTLTASGNRPNATPLAGSPLTFTASAATPMPTSLSLVSGQNQLGTDGAALSQPLAVRVHDQGGNPMPNATVNWSVVHGSGSLASATSTSDATGLAQVGYTYGGTAPSSNIVQARVGEIGLQIFYASAQPASTTKRWVGGDATSPDDWSVATNWAPSGVPSSSDNVFIPPTGNQAMLTADAAIHDFVLDSVASFDMSGHQLTVHGNAVGNGGVTTSGGASTVVVDGTAATTLHGAYLAKLVIGGASCGRFALDGTTTADSVIVNCPLDVGANSLFTSGSVRTAATGTIALSSASSQVAAQGDVTFAGSGTSALTYGTLMVGGNLSFGSGAATTATSSIVDLIGTSPQTITLASPSAITLAELLIYNTTAGVQFSVGSPVTMNAVQALVLQDRATLTIPTGLTVNTPQLTLLGPSASLVLNGSITGVTSCSATTGQITGTGTKPAACP